MLEVSEVIVRPTGGAFLVPGKESWRPRKADKKAELFNGCIMGTVFADTNRAAARVMAHNGNEVTVPVRQQCCGALAVHSGMMEEARTLAKQNIDAFEAGGDAAIIVTAAGCGAALKEYGFLLKHDPEYAERAERFSARVKDVTEYLASQPFAQPTKSINRTVTSQEPSHRAHAQPLTAQRLRCFAAPVIDDDHACSPLLRLSQLRQADRRRVGGWVFTPHQDQIGMLDIILHLQHVGAKAGSRCNHAVGDIAECTDAAGVG